MRRRYLSSYRKKQQRRKCGREDFFKGKLARLCARPKSQASESGQESARGYGGSGSVETKNGIARVGRFAVLLSAFRLRRHS